MAEVQKDIHKGYLNVENRMHKTRYIITEDRSHKRPTMLILKSTRNKTVTNVLIPESIGRYERQYTYM